MSWVNDAYAERFTYRTLNRRALAEIQGNTFEWRGRSAASRLFRAKNDKDAIAIWMLDTWMLDLNRVLHVVPSLPYDMDFATPRAAPLPPNPSLPTIPTVPSLPPLDPTQQSDSVVASTPGMEERAKERAKRTRRILSAGFPSPSMDFHTLPTTTFGLGLEGIELEIGDGDGYGLHGYRQPP